MNKVRVTQAIVNRYGNKPFKYGQLRVGDELRFVRQTKSGNVYYNHDNPYYTVMIDASDVHLLEPC